MAWFSKGPFQKIPNNIINNKQECPLVDDEEDWSEEDEDDDDLMFALNSCHDFDMVESDFASLDRVIDAFKKDTSAHQSLSFSFLFAATLVRLPPNCNEFLRHFRSSGNLLANCRPSNLHAFLNFGPLDCYIMTVHSYLTLHVHL
jgi:hypothetical protein